MQETFARQLHREHIERRSRLWQMPPAPEPPPQPPPQTQPRPVKRDFLFLATPILSTVATMKKIRAIVTLEYGVSVIDLMSKRRTKNVAFPRQVAMYLAKTVTLRSLPEIGRFFGGKDHTTVLHAVRKIEAMRRADPAMDETIKTLEAKLRGEE